MALQPTGSIRSGCGGVDHLPHLGDLGGREAAHLSVLTDRVLVLGQIDAERLVVGYVALDPLNVGSKLVERLVGLRRSAAKLLALERAYLRDFPLDDEPAAP